MKRLLIGLSVFAAVHSLAWSQGTGQLDFKGAAINALISTIVFGALGGILFWMIAGRYWGKPRTKPYQLGLWWGAWLVAASVMAIGGKYVQLGFEEVFFSMILTVPTFFGIGFIAGFLFRKISPIAGTLPNGSTTSTNVSGASDVDFAEAMAEIEESRMDKGLWARCFAESDGDHGKAKASYIRQRAAVLAALVIPSNNGGVIALKPADSANFATPILVLLVIGGIVLTMTFYKQEKNSPDKPDPVAPFNIVPQSKPSQSNECQVWWDGVAVQFGGKKGNPNFVTYKFERLNTTYALALPKDLMDEKFGKNWQRELNARTTIKAYGEMDPLNRHLINPLEQALLACPPDG